MVGGGPYSFQRDIFRIKVRFSEDVNFNITFPSYFLYLPLVYSICWKVKFAHP